MTARERILSVLKGGIPDRVPVVPFIQEEYLNWRYPGRSAYDRVESVLELAYELPFDVMAKHNRFMTPHCMLHDHPGWRVRRDRQREGDLWVTRIEITTPDRTLTQEIAVPDAGAVTSGLMATTRRHMFREDGDIESFIRHLPASSAADADAMRAVSAEWKARIGERGVSAPWGWAGVFNYAAELWGIENLMMAPYTSEPLYRALMERITDAMIAYNRPLIEGGADLIGIQGHIANSGSVSPEYFMNYVFPYEKRLIDAIHAQGAFTVYHNCGYASTFYEIYCALGMTVWETVSEPPQGDNSLAEVKRTTAGRICLLGNLDQIHFLKTASPAEVADKTREIVRIGKPGGRYLFAASDFLERGTPHECVKAMLDAAIAEGSYAEGW
jgi:uroporphyrinogen decarboxylase